ncbi:hypothetical protein AB433_06505 [Croceicoccus naphthovorans]|uniref:Uncharacterized protein n=1 Tax=Croceicoccus naphthovorans TaxID=1348774 RepID=A0A0G3XH71_9SPHN|nr:hypothetical protein AB433_06505 [Croceicoccus naphthovorans]
MQPNRVYSPADRRQTQRRAGCRERALTGNALSGLIWDDLIAGAEKIQPFGVGRAYRAVRAREMIEACNVDADSTVAE